jgi:hypothetical protein
MHAQVTERDGVPLQRLDKPKKAQDLQCGKDTYSVLYIPVAKNNSGGENQDVALILQKSLDQLTDVLLYTKFTIKRNKNNKKNFAA